MTLFNDTVMNNIRLGNPNATDDQVIAAAKAAYCDEFVREMPDGYQTVLGENGSTLSGGERQRISIARALLKNAPIILLDEATASLDPENEVLVQKAIAKLVEGKTVIMIAHRLRTVVDADQILVLDNGRLVEHGTHDELMKKNGLYSIVSFLRKERYNIIIPVILSYRADFCVSRSSYKKTVTRPGDFTRYPITVAVCGGNCDFLLG